LNFFVTFSKKQSNIKIYENPSSGIRVVPCGRTDRHDEADAFHNFAIAPEEREVQQ
jgi:hypothetical protein